MISCMAGASSSWGKTFLSTKTIRRSRAVSTSEELGTGCCLLPRAVVGTADVGWGLIAT